MQLQMVGVGIPIERLEDIERLACQIFDRRHNIEHDCLVAGQRVQKFRDRFVRGRNQKGVVPKINQMRFCNFLYLAEVHHHAVTGALIVADNLTGQGYFDGVAVPMKMPALALMIRDSMACVELQAAGDLHGKGAMLGGTAL